MMAFYIIIISNIFYENYNLTKTTACTQLCFTIVVGNTEFNIIEEGVKGNLGFLSRTSSLIPIAYIDDHGVEELVMAQPTCFDQDDISCIPRLHYKLWE